MEIAIVGAGPAGASVAILLAQGGLRPLLIDGSHPRDKPCGGLLEEGDIDAWGELRRFSGAIPFGGDRLFTTPRGTTVAIPARLAASRCVVVSRRALDLHLAGRAEALGARFIRSGVAAIARDGLGWRLATFDGATHRADLVVGADGVRSIVRRATAGPFSRRELVAAAGRRFPGMAVTNMHTVALDGGCAGSMMPGVGCAQAIVGGPPGAALRVLLEAFVRRVLGRGTDGVPFSALHPAPPGPAFFDPPRAGDGWMLLGDAAGFCNRATGEGMRYAFASAHAAAAAILAGRPAGYDARWRDTIGAELRAAARRSHFETPGAIAEAGALLLARAPRLTALAHRLSRRRRRAGGMP